MQALLQYKERDLIFFDVETARVIKKLEKGTPLYDAWAYKMRYENEIAKKSGVDVLALEESFESKASLYAPFSRIVCIVVGTIQDGDKLRTRVFADADERTLLTNFNNALIQKTTAQPEALFCGFNNEGFDEPFIGKRCLVNGVPLHPLLDQSTKKPWDTRRLDLSKVWRGNSFYPDSLSAVAVAMGLPSPKQSLSGDEVGNVYYEGKLNEIITYCKGDVLTSANLYRLWSGKKILSFE